MLVLAACDSGPGVSDWAITPDDLGEPVASGAGFDPTDGAALGAAFPELLPGFDGDVPTADVPLTIWSYALHELVAEEGVCPYKELDGAITTFQSHCRSKSGYDWEGSVRVEGYDTDGGGEGVRYDFDVEVVGDVEGRRFDSLALRGAVVRVTEGDVEHVDVNLMAELLGYFEARNQPDDPRITSWSSWAASGSVETVGTALAVDLTAEVAGSGGFTLVGADLELDAGCPSEPTGTVALSETVSAEFQGVAACDACATITGGDAEAEACAP